MLVPRKARQQCLLWCTASLCLSATVLLLDWTTVAETARFEGGTQIWCTCMEDPFNLGGRTLHRWNLRLMPNISYLRKAHQRCLLWCAASLCLSATVLTLDEPIVVKLRFLRRYPSLMPSLEGNLLTQRHQITFLETRDPRLPYGENPESLAYLGLIRYWVVTPGQTDGQTDRIPIAYTRSQQYLPVQLSRVKMVIVICFFSISCHINVT